jgi:hypothetical protein
VSHPINDQSKRYRRPRAMATQTATMAGPT